MEHLWEIRVLQESVEILLNQEVLNQEEGARLRTARLSIVEYLRKENATDGEETINQHWKSDMRWKNKGWQPSLISIKQAASATGPSS